MAEYKQIVSTTFEDTEDKSSIAGDNMFGEKQRQDAVTVRFADTYQVR